MLISDKDKLTALTKDYLRFTYTNTYTQQITNLTGCGFAEAL